MIGTFESKKRKQIKKGWNPKCRKATVFQPLLYSNEELSKKVGYANAENLRKGAKLYIGDKSFSALDTLYSVFVYVDTYQLQLVCKCPLREFCRVRERVMLFGEVEPVATPEGVLIRNPLYEIVKKEEQ